MIPKYKCSIHIHKNKSFRTVKLSPKYNFDSLSYKKYLVIIDICILLSILEDKFIHVIFTFSNAAT
jgi:hypothetical protein